MSAEGSSPLTRGGHPHALDQRRAGGIIPAHAGRAQIGPGGSVAARDHPRSRGAGAEAEQLAWGTLGSSPLTRGGRPVPRSAV